ncbi:MAG: translocation/assembly module TamB domain-containing protein [Lentimicrobium sp.]
MGTRVHIGGLDISWFLNVVLEDVIVEDKSGRDILNARSIKLDFGKLNRKGRYIGIYAASLKHAEINLVLNASDSLMNYSFLIDYFTGTDTTTSKTEAKPWKIGISGIGLQDCSFNYNNELKGYSESGVDFDHLGIRNLNLDLRRIKIESDSITARINSLSFHEKSGFILKEFFTEITVMPEKIAARNLNIVTPQSDIRLDLTFRHRGYEAYNEFIDSVKMTGDFSESKLNLNDISYFAPEITGMDNEIRLKGIVKGTVSSLKARKFSFSFGKNTTFEGNINMDGLPDIEETFIHLKIKNLVTDYLDLKGIMLPGKDSLGIPEDIRKLGIIRINGYFTGFYNDFVSSANFNTEIGSIVTDLSLKMVKIKTIDYSGHLNLINWDLGKTFPDAGQFGFIDFSSAITGRVEEYKIFDLDVDAIVNSVGLYGNEFHNIKIDGDLSNREFNGKLTLTDKLVNLDFKGIVDFTDSLPRMNFTSTVKNAYLSKLNIWDRDSSSCLSTRMDLDFTGTNIDNLLGSIRFDSTFYAENKKLYQLKELALLTNIDQAGNKSLSLKSDYADADFNGKFTFADFYYSLANIISTYIPSLQLSARKDYKIEKEQLFDYTINVKNTDPLTELFLPDFRLKSKATLFGSFNSTTETILINGEAGKFDFNGIHFNDWYIRGQNLGRSLQVTTGNSSIVWKDPDKDDPQRLGIDNFAVTTFLHGDSVRYSLTWKNNDSLIRNMGDIRGTMLFAGSPQINVSLDTVNLVINDEAWFLTQEGYVIVDTSLISINNLIISGKNQNLRLNGKISENPDDVLNLWFDQFDVSNLDALISQSDLNFDGILNGKVTLTDLYHARTIQSDLTIDKFAFNDEQMGDARIISWWDNEQSGLGVDATIIYHGNVGTHNPLAVKGFIYPSERELGNFDLDVSLINYKLASLNPFLEGFASQLKGMASGSLKMAGTFGKPEIIGNIQLLRTQMKIDYLNVTYSFADQVKIETDLISAEDIIIYDSLGNTGTLDFRLTHDFFSNMKLDMSVNANKLAGLNTTLKQNELFYGSAFATGLVTIKGPFSDLQMDIRVRSEANTNIFIPINLAVDASENEYIRFLTHDETDAVENIFEANTAGINLDMLLDVTKDANIQIFLPEDIGNIKGNGTGEIRMGIDTRGDITMFGDYRMNQGTFLFSFKNILNRVFSIEPGSVISFRGSPYDADIALRAVYKLRASLKSIPEIADMPEYAGKTVPVNCIISLKNNLYNPDIAFSFQLPDADQVLRQHVYSSIDTTNEAIMAQQMVSLLLMKSFSFSAGNTNLAASVGSSSIEMLTNQLSNMLSQISKDVDIGLNYRTGSAMSSEEIELALSTHLFNDRVTVDGNLGVTTAGSTQNANNIVGDVTIDVKITPDGRFRVKAFNKANNPFDLSSTYATYKQGVGFYYRYEFDKFSEFFRRSKKKSTNPQ